MLSSFGMVGVLVLLGAVLSIATVRDEVSTGVDAADRVLAGLGSQPDARIVIITKPGAADDLFVQRLQDQIHEPARLVRTVRGEPRDARRALEELSSASERVDAVAVSGDVAGWTVFSNMQAEFPGLTAPGSPAPRVVFAAPRRGSAFLNTGNLRNILNQMVVIGLAAVGMTLVIISAGIDLSVGSLIALSAVTAAWIIRAMGGPDAGVGAMILACAAAILLCGGIGLGSGLMITRLRLPPFIATLGVMQIASGLAFSIAKGQTIYEVPGSFSWLGQKASFLGIPNAVVLTAAVYALGHVVLGGTVFGRRLYAVGGNREAARRAGVPVERVVIAAYVVSGVTAGLGGVVTASLLTSGAGTYGASYELFAIAAVVVGGASLTGGEGRIGGTLIGALIIAVIQNGMNLLGVESYAQKIVLGAVILAAVFLDMFRRHGTRLFDARA